MNTVDASPKQQILAYVKQMTISEEKFNAFNEKIDKKLAERVLQAREIEKQPELQEIYELYKKAVETHKVNLKTQYDLGQKTFQQIQAIEDLSKVMGILQAFQAAIEPVLEVHKKLEEEIKSFEGRIVTLLPVGTTFIL